MILPTLKFCRPEIQTQPIPDMPNSDSNTNNTQEKGGRSVTSCSLRAATIAVLGSVAAISEELYMDALEQIAEMSGTENTTEMWQEVDEILRTLPCPID